MFGSRGCAECHGANGGGATLVDDGKGLKLAGPNITAGLPRMAAYQPVDWVRSIRHGVGTDGHALRLMPSEDYNRLTDDDLASVVAYIRQLPPQSGREHGTIEHLLVMPVRPSEIAMAKIAAKVIAGKKLSELNISMNMKLKHVAVKEAVFPFIKFKPSDRPPSIP